MGSPRRQGSGRSCSRERCARVPTNHVTIVGENWKEVVRSLREESGKEIWLFGGGSLFRSLAEEGFVDTVEVAIIPILLGKGIRLSPNRPRESP